MAYSARKLITKAYYLSAFASRRLNTISGQEMTDGLSLLNDLIADKSVDMGMIPFYKEYDFVAITDQVEDEPGVYFIPDLIEVDTFTFNISQPRFGTLKLSRSQFFASSRVDGVTALPTTWHPERVNGGMNIYLYPLPNDTYPLKIWGKFGLPEITSLDQDLSLTYERNYLNYMRYELGQFICSENGLTFDEQSNTQLDRYRKSLRYVSPIDLTNSKISTLTTGMNVGLNLPYNSLFSGWVP